MKCWMIELTTAFEHVVQVAGPSGPSNRYSFSMRTIGIMRRFVLSASRALVIAFSSASSSMRGRVPLFTVDDLGQAHVTNLLSG